MKAIIIDDEVYCHEVLKLDLNMYCPSIDVIATCSSPYKGLNKIKELRPDVVFLDIEMPGMTGFELLQNVGQIDFAVVFTTAYNEYAIKAFEYHATDYLLKPIRKEKLISCVDNISKKRKDIIRHQDIHKLIASVNTLYFRDATIVLPTNDGLECVQVSSMMYAKEDGKFTALVLGAERKLLIDKDFSELKEMLNSNDFVQISDGCIVNLNFIQKYNFNNGKYVVLADDITLDVDDVYYESLLNLIKKKSLNPVFLTPRDVVNQVPSLENDTSSYTLSPREKEVIDLIFEGYSYKMVAHELDLSLNTVRSYIKNIYQKLDVNSATEAIKKIYY